MTSANALAAGAGCYDAGRAAALTGVPKSTVYWWARSGVVVPSVSPTAEKLWSYNDLIALRIVSWLRHPKSGGQLPANPMPNVRQALAVLDAQGIDLWHRQHRCSLLVDRKSRIFIRSGEDIQDLYGQPTLLPAETLDLTQPFAMDGAVGPDLIQPGPRLRIVPAKVAGEPHIEGTRLTTQTIAALYYRGYPSGPIADLYQQPVAAVEAAIKLEAQLASQREAA